MKELEELLKKKGWVKGSRCKSCGGVIKYPFTSKEHPGYEIIIFPSRSLFHLKRDGKRVVTGSLVNLRHQYILQ